MADHEVVDDPFRPGEKCKEWQTKVEPNLRTHEAYRRALDEMKAGSK
jgi:hypothetical protein